MITNASVFAPKHELLSLSWTHYLPDSFCDKVAYTGLAVNRRKKLVGHRITLYEPHSP